MTTDLIDRALVITPGSHLDQLRRHREVARDNIQKAYDALFAPVDAKDVSLAERFAIAAFVTGLHGQLVLGDHYAHRLAGADTDTAAAINSEIERGTATGPYGNYPDGPLSSENKAGLRFAVSEANRAALGQKLSAALDHAHLLVYRPRDASKVALDALLAAGWSTAGIVTISQLVAYLSFQVRIVEGLSALAATHEASHPADRLPKVAPASAIA
jgi:CMD domain protein